MPMRCLCGPLFGVNPLAQWPCTSTGVAGFHAVLCDRMRGDQAKPRGVLSWQAISASATRAGRM